MNTRILTALACITVLTGTTVLTAYGCSSSNNNNNNPTVPGNDAGNDAGTPTPPTLGAQIDRLGRPAINTALNNTFNTNTTDAGVAKDAYNADSNLSDWVTEYVPQFEQNLAIYDSLDGVCGNQLLYTPDAGADAGPSAYAPLAGVLADDRLYLNTAVATCTTYLAVELTAVGLDSTPDCGGRAPSYNVIDPTYSALALGATSGVTNGVTAPASPPSMTFPYLATPH